MVAHYQAPILNEIGRHTAVSGTDDLRLIFDQIRTVAVTFNDLILFCIPFENISIIWGHHHCGEVLQNIDLCSALTAFVHGGDLYSGIPAMILDLEQKERILVYTYMYM